MPDFLAKCPLIKPDTQTLKLCLKRFTTGQKWMTSAATAAFRRFVEFEEPDDECREHVYVNLDNHTITLAASVIQSAEVSSNFPTVGYMDVGLLLPSQGSAETARVKPTPTTTTQGKIPRQKRCGVIRTKRDRDKSKSKRKKSLAKWVRS